MAIRILFRADAGLEIGTGHVMRCLTLADALRAEGADIVFVTRGHRGHVIPNITASGYRTVVLPGNTGVPYGAHPSPPAHARWLEADWRTDAAATYKAMEVMRADWLVMDHYALDSAWQSAALPDGVRLMVLDDLADRVHLADVLLDQNAGRHADDYSGLVPARCDLRIGPAYALLRPEFIRLRPEALARRATLERPETLLITLGGIDKNNATGRVLDALAGWAGIAGLRLSVVMGASAPHLEAVRARAAEMLCPIEVAAGVSDMAERMTRADLCIGAAGSTAWERCALGLPTLQVVLANNQVEVAQSMADAGLSLALPSPEAPDFAGALAAGLEHLSQPDRYCAMARAAAEVINEAWTAQLAAQMLNLYRHHA